MNSDFSNPPQEERELRLTALLLGELSTDEAAQLHLAIAADPELACELARLQQTIDLVHETSALDRKVSSDGSPLTLDDRRRQKLLEAFKKIAPRPAAPLPRRQLWYVPMSLAATLVGLLVVVVSLPKLARSKARAHRTSTVAFFETEAVSPAESVAPENAGLTFETRDQVDRLGKASSDGGAATARDSARARLVGAGSSSSAAASANPSARRQFGDQSPAAGSLAVGDTTVKLPPIGFSGNGVVDSAGYYFNLGTIAEGDVNGAASLAATAPVNPESFLSSTLTIREGFAAPGAPVRRQGQILTDFDTDHTPLPAGLPARAQKLYLGAGDKEAGKAIDDGVPLAPALLASQAGSGESLFSVNAVGDAYQNGNADFNPVASPGIPASEFRELASSGGGTTYAGVSRVPGSGVRRGVGDGLGSDSGASVKGDSKRSVFEASRREMNSKQTLLEAESEWIAPMATAPQTFARARILAVKPEDALASGFGGFAGGTSRAPAAPNPGEPGRASAAPGLQPLANQLSLGKKLEANHSDLGLAHVNEVTPGRASVDGLALGANVPLDAQRETKVPGNSKTWNSQDSMTGIVSPANDTSFNSSGTVNFFHGFTDDQVKAQISTSGTGEAQPAEAARFGFGNRLNRPLTPAGDAAGGGSAAPGPALADGVDAYVVDGSAWVEAVKQEGRVDGRVAIQLPRFALEDQVGWRSSPTQPAREASLAGVAKEAPRAVDIAGLPGIPPAATVNEALAKVVPQESEVRLEAQSRNVVTTLPLPAKASSVVAQKLVENQLAQAPITNASGPQAWFANPSAFPPTNVVSRGSAAAARLEVVQAAEPPPVAKSSASAPKPQPEVLTSDNAFSTFSLNVSDVSFKLAAASLEKGAWPEGAGLRSEEFLNAFDYRDPMPAAGAPVAFAWERARYPFAHHRDVLRFSVKTAAQGREGSKPLNIVLLLDNSGSMERADRVRIIQESLRSLAAQLKPQDKLSVVTFSRTPRLWADGVTGAQAAGFANTIAALTPEGGTNLEDALNLAYRTALRHYSATAVNRVVLLTDGAANLGNVEPKTLQAKVEGFRKQGVALDCFGIGWDGFNDDLLEQLSRHGDGRYGFVNTPEEAATELVDQLAGALRVAASDVKVQVEFNPKRVTAYRQIGYAKHRLTKQQFRDNTVDAAEIGAAEAGNGLYLIETNPRGEGPIATVRARFRIPQTSEYREHEWVVPFGSVVDLEQSSPAMRLATSASAFAEWLAGSPFAGEVTTDRLLGLMSGVPEVYGADTRPKKLEWMIRQAKSILGK